MDSVAAVINAYRANLPVSTIRENLINGTLNAPPMKHKGSPMMGSHDNKRDQEPYVL